MTVDKDGKIRMDCSSPYAMAGLIGLKDKFDIAFGNDPDYDRHGIVTRSHGLMNPNHYLAAAIWYLFQNRPGWRTDAAVGKTLVSSAMIDRVAAHLGRRLSEVPVGFKWFVDGLINGSRTVSEVKKAPGPPSSDWTARSGPRTRTASSWIFWLLKLPPAPNSDPGGPCTRTWKAGLAAPYTNAWMLQPPAPKNRC